MATAAERKSSGSDYLTSSSVTTPESFSLETKFVVLNFFSYDPHGSPPYRIYTPTTSTSESDHVTYRKKLSVKSLPNTPGQVSHRKRSKGNPVKLQKLRNLGESEDNITHRYYSLQRKDIELDGSIDSVSLGTLDQGKLAVHDKQHKASSLDSIIHRYEQSKAGEPCDHKEINDLSFDHAHEEAISSSNFRQYSTSRTVSEISSFGENSYDSDADDEYEDSNATNKFRQQKGSMSGSGRGDKRHDGIDWLQVDRLPTVPSESETEDINLLTPNTGIFDPHLGDESATQFGFEFANSEQSSLLSDHSSYINDTLVHSSAGDQAASMNVGKVFGSDENERESEQKCEKEEEDTLEEIYQSGFDSVDAVGSLCDFLGNSSMENNPSASLGSDAISGTESTSISFFESTNDTTASSSFDMTDTCRDGHKVVDRSKLKLDIPKLGNLVQAAQMQAVVESMRAELEDEMTTLESEVEEAIKNRVINPVVSPFLSPVMTPQTEAAKILAKIGDEVKDMYEDRLQTAMRRLFIKQQVALSYETFKNVAKDVVDDTLPGWRQVALLLVYGQSVVWRAVETGHHGIGNLVDHTSRLVADMAADFIIQQGGWGAVMNFNPSQSSDSPLFSTPDSLRDVSPWAPVVTEESNPVQLDHKLSKSFQSCLNQSKAEGTRLNLTANNNVRNEGDITPEFVGPTDSLGSLSTDSIDEVNPDMLYFNHTSEKDTTGEDQKWWRTIFKTYFIMVHVVYSGMLVYFISKNKH